MPSKIYSKHHNHIPFHSYFNESSAMYITATLRNLALSLIGIFLPIYIIELPSKISLFSDTFFNGIAWVLVYFMIRSIITALFTLFLSNFIFLKLTLRKSILVSSL
ncbi:hypothetical protein KJ596_00005, partial [Patescibacteria group bacterium]|nr:hypothetical protein [Patescibacteria group bacterium]